MPIVDLPELIERRRSYAAKRLQLVKDRVVALESVQGLPNLCIYATGSYGRLEASEFSDLDVFFVNTSPSDVPNLQKKLIDADLIRLGRDLGFPEFSGDAKYLEIHKLDTLCDALGSPQDDFHNLFTARILLLLESQPICNVEAYEIALQKVVDTYFRDYQDHAPDFHPLFLINDIQRYWRTVCLNYEYGRRGDLDDHEKAKQRLKNLKLKVTRLMTCFSGVAAILHAGEGVDPAEIVRLVHESPTTRVQQAAAGSSKAEELAKSVLSDYAWFLDALAQPPDPLLAWLSNESTRHEAFDRAREFGHRVYRLVAEVGGDTSLRYLVI